MVHAKYNRSPVLSFFDLTKENQKDVIYIYGEEGIEDKQFVLHNFINDEGKGCHNALPLDMFMRLDNSKVWHGVYSTSYFSAYFVRFNRMNDEVLVAERFT